MSQFERIAREQFGAPPVMPEEEDIEIELGDPEEEGGELPPELTSEIPFDANLAEYMDEDRLTEIADDLLDLYDADKMSRAKWEKMYVEGLDLLGLERKDMSEPWPGACGVFYPLLIEAAVRFQSHSIAALMPAGGPAKTEVRGKLDIEKTRIAGRVQEELNYLITDKMTEFRPELEKAFFSGCLAGSAFKKVYYDADKDRPKSVFIPAEDLIVPYGATDIDNAPRITHVMKKWENELARLMAAGFYREVELPEPQVEYTEIERKESDINRVDASVEHDDRYTLLEMKIDYDLEAGFDDAPYKLPYIITIEKQSKEILSIRRNWAEGDKKHNPRQHYVHYEYIPGFGFYGIGLIHLIGGIAESSTLILRQLVDAGSLSNLRAGFKTRGLRITGDNTPLFPGEWRDVDIGSGALKDNIMPVPYGEPSAVLFQLLQNLVQEGRKVGAVAEMPITDVNSEAPVGTTLALIETSQKVMSAIQARLHYAMKQELWLISGIVRDFMPEEYEYVTEPGTNRRQDFSTGVNIIPVSDPNASTLSQRIMQYQAALQLAQANPADYNLALLHRQMLEIIGIPDADQIVKLPDDFRPMDPVLENMSILKQEPVKAFLYQDHEAHITVHMALAQDPKIRELVGQSQSAPAIQAAMEAHITEHIAYAYRAKIEMEMGVALPAPDQPLPEDVEVELSKVMAEAGQRVLQKDTAEQAAAAAQQAAQDPVIQMQQRELDLKELKIKLDAAESARDAALRERDAERRANSERERIASQEKIAGAQIGASLVSGAQDRATREKIDGLRIGADTATKIIQTDKQTSTQKEIAKTNANRPRPGSR